MQTDPALVRQLAVEWSLGSPPASDLEVLWDSPRRPDDIRPALQKCGQYKAEVQLGLSPVPARVVAPNALTDEKYFTDFNEGCVWELEDREIFIGVTFSEYDVSIMRSRRPKG